MKYKKALRIKELRKSTTTEATVETARPILPFQHRSQEKRVLSPEEIAFRERLEAIGEPRPARSGTRTTMYSTSSFNDFASFSRHTTSGHNKRRTSDLSNMF
jgi:hypothetical protein